MSFFDPFIVAKPLEGPPQIVEPEIREKTRRGPELVEKPVRKKYDKFREVYECVLRGSPHISPR